jgi:hypothetical protein
MPRRLRRPASQGIRLKGDDGDSGDMAMLHRAPNDACVIDVTFTENEKGEGDKKKKKKKAKAENRKK